MTQEPEVQKASFEDYRAFEVRAGHNDRDARDIAASLVEQDVPHIDRAIAWRKAQLAEGINRRDY